ncbi:MAG: hypothetical protein JWR14_5849 [Caballeronia sp.]|uniref:hypothetical protein n=1 Tax=Caballeronia sp. TaxID=1931223 RepID=UPI00260B26FB|nr:hypothetical protein [Caballeronia sp.]MDB5836019.1 hypothetical protein [Caballeronia sp.]
MKSLVQAVRIGLFILVGAASAHASAYALDDQLDCKSTAHAFIAPLQENHAIEATPMRVESNSINAFKPTRDSHLTAFDFGVFAVVGFQKNDAIFKQGNGDPISDSAYGAVVIGGEDSVKQKVRAAGSDAVIHRVAPFITAIFCKRDSPQLATVSHD